MAKSVAAYLSAAQRSGEMAAKISAWRNKISMVAMAIMKSNRRNIKANVEINQHHLGVTGERRMAGGVTSMAHQ